MLETSILDSGPGLARKISGKNNLSEISIEREVELVKECLIKHRTTSKSFSSTIKGQGLDKVLKLLDKKGFLRIRTGRLELFRNFISDPYTESYTVDKVVLKDFISNSLNYTALPEASGTLYTFYYPIGGE
jgi:hypothetical protein